MTDPILRMTGIVKQFPGVRALDGVELEVAPGEVHCLLGQNGAGKSTLIKVLAGAHQPDEGESHVERRAGPPQRSRRRPCGWVSPPSTRSSTSSTVSRSPRTSTWATRCRTAGFSRRGESSTGRGGAARPARSSGDPADDRDVGRLSAAGKQVVSMARAMSHDSKVLIMDEPSAVLDQEEVRNLFRVIRDLTREGVAVIYISHRLEEIREIGDRVTVLKDGRTVATGLPASDTPTAELIKLMTGRAIEYVFPSAAAASGQPTEAVLDGPGAVPSRRVRGGEPSSRARVRSSASPDWSAPGARRSWRRSTVRARPAPAACSVRGKRLRSGSVAAAVNAGVGLAPEERKSQGLLLTSRCTQHHTVRPCPGSPGSLVRPRSRAEGGRGTGQEPGRPAPNASASGPHPVRRQPAEGRAGPMVAAGLSSAAARRADPRRRRGRADRDLRAGPHARRRRRRRSSWSRSEIDEVLGLADRVLVLREGRIVHEGPADEIDEHRVLDLVMEGNVA